MPIAKNFDEALRHLEYAAMEMASTDTRGEQAQLAPRPCDSTDLGRSTCRTTGLDVSMRHHGASLCPPARPTPRSMGRADLGKHAEEPVHRLHQGATTVAGEAQTGRSDGEG